MPYLRLLEQLLQAVPGSESALLLDAQGEVVVQAGTRQERHLLIGAYQGIGLAMAKRAVERFDAGSIGYMVCRYSGGSVVLRPLKDGYYLAVQVPPDAVLAHAIRHSAQAQVDMNAEL